MSDSRQDNSAGPPLIRLDPGWLFLAVGIALLTATVLIPAMEDLEEARWQRDRALAIERHRLERLERYGAYLDAVERGEEAVVIALAAEQLNKVPAGWRPLAPVAEPAQRSASVFPALEPAPLHIPPRVKVQSRLTRLTSNDRTRLGLLVAGGMCLLIGVMPAVRAEERAEERAGGRATGRR